MPHIDVRIHFTSEPSGEYVVERFEGVTALGDSDKLVDATRGMIAAALEDSQYLRENLEIACTEAAFRSHEQTEALNALAMTMAERERTFRSEFNRFMGNSR